MNKFIDGLLYTVVCALCAMSLGALGTLFYKSIKPADDWQLDRILVCNGPGTPSTRLTSAAEKIRYDKARHFEIEVRGQKFVYVPGYFDTCFTLPNLSINPALPNAEVSSPGALNTKD